MIICVEWLTAGIMSACMGHFLYAQVWAPKRRDELSAKANRASAFTIRK